MKSTFYFFSNYILFIFVAIILAALQCSLWLQVFGSFPAPQLWVPIMTYWHLYRRPRESVIMSYILSTVISVFTAFTWGHILFLVMILLIMVILVKSRIYWPGSTFFMLAVGVIVLMVPILHAAISWTFEKNPVHDPQVFDWLMSALLTMLFSLPLHRLFVWIDMATIKDQMNEGAPGAI